MILFHPLLPLPFFFTRLLDRSEIQADLKTRHFCCMNLGSTQTHRISLLPQFPHLQIQFYFLNVCYLPATGLDIHKDHLTSPSKELYKIVVLILIL